jgi:hypothetical protein
MMTHYRVTATYPHHGGETTKPLTLVREILARDGDEAIALAHAWAISEGERLGFIGDAIVRVDRHAGVVQ